MFGTQGTKRALVACVCALVGLVGLPAGTGAQERSLEETVRQLEEKIASLADLISGLGAIEGLRAGKDGRYLKVPRNDGEEVAWLGTSTAGRGLLTLRAPEVKQDVVVAEADGNNDGRFRIRNSKGELRVELNVNDGDAGWVETFNTKGKSIVRLTHSTDTDGGYISVRSADGEAQAALYAKSDSGRLWTNGNDYAEVFELSDREGVVPGAVMCIDPGVPGSVMPCESEASPLVVGVVSGAGALEPGLVLGARRDGSVDLPIALGGQVLVLADTSCGPIEPGDQLVSSSVPGWACAAEEPRSGTVLGKAMGRLGKGEGLVLMLVAPR